jgi:hypothetical protein
MKRFVLLLFAVLLSTVGSAGAQATYSLPNNNSGCPLNCRQIPWQTGSDIWNGGTLPNYTGVACTGLHDDGVTDDGPGIQACDNALSSNQCVLVPAGTNYYINSTVYLKSNTCLRGAKTQGGPPFLPTGQSGETRFVIGSSGQLQAGDIEWNGGASTLNPQVFYGSGSLPSTFSLSGTPQKGDTQLTIGSGTVSVGTWMLVYGNDDPSTVSNTGQDGFCPWCGANDGAYIRSQIVQVTSIVSGSGGSGSVVNISKPLYYPLYTSSVNVTCPNGSGTCTEPSGAKYSIITWSATHVGFENLRVDGSQHDTGPNRLLLVQACLECWVKNVETYVTGSNSLSAHVETDGSYAAEIRDSAFHDQRSGASGAGYGIYFQWFNSDHKVENNIVFHSRHGLINQGGDSGTTWLYNFVDDLYTDDGSYLGSTRSVHGGHSLFNLYEGNIISHYVGDDISGSASHHVLFRNWLWGGETNTTWPAGNLSAFAYPLGGFPPNNGFAAVDLYPCNIYYSAVDNILGSNALTSGGYWPNWTAATYSSFNEAAPIANPLVYSLANATTSYCPSPMPTPVATIITQGNWNQFNGVPGSEGATSSYGNSLYYSSEPSFISSASCGWPEQGSDLSIKGSTQQPAYQRAFGTTCSGGTPTANSPTFSPTSPYSGPATTVTASTNTTGCNGNVYLGTTNPPTVNTNTFSFTSSTTLYSYVHGCSGYNDSPIVSWTGTIATPTLATPTLSPNQAPNNYLPSSFPLAVTPTIPSGSKGCYTLNGISPTAPTAGTCGSGSSTYTTGSVSVAANQTLSMLATQAGFLNSSVLAATYNQRNIVLNATGIFNGGSATASTFTTSRFTPNSGDGITCEITLGTNVTITSVTDNANGTYAPAAAQTAYDAGTDSLSAIYFISNAQNTAIQVTVNLSGPSTFNGIACQSWTPSSPGAFNSDSGFQRNSTGSTANPTAGATSAPAQSNELLIGGMANLDYPAVVPTAGSGFTFVTSLTNENYFSEYQVQASATSTVLSWVQAADPWLAQQAGLFFSSVTPTAPTITGMPTITGTATLTGGP